MAQHTAITTDVDDNVDNVPGVDDLLHYFLLNT